MALTGAEATLWGAIIGSLGIAVGGAVKWVTGRRSAEERNAQFWRDQVQPLTERVTSLETELTRVKDTQAVDRRDQASKLQQVQVAHAETLRAVQEKAAADITAVRMAGEVHARELTAQFALELEERDAIIVGLQDELRRLRLPPVGKDGV